MIRHVSAVDITESASKLLRQACCELDEDVLGALKNAYRVEESLLGREVINTIVENAAIAVAEKLPLCQDCGTIVVFLEIGQEVHIVGGEIVGAVDEGVRVAVKEGYLRSSIVERPFTARRNTGDNTPAIVHTEVVPGDKLKISVLPRGGGAENMSRLGMLLPSAGREGVIDFITKTVDEAWSKPCPPLILGVGIGGTGEKALAMAKHALLRRLGEPSPDKEVAGLEYDILHRVNRLGIGPMGYGGKVTALAVHAESFPAHITSLPVAVNFQCHSARHREIVL
ncbi:MAG TPA: fumarate hydratase [Dehalococcoidales bacterium]|nr:fumarate hydratase [Dehalococcoidales bacterium]